MSARFVINLLDFVRDSGAHHGKIPLAELERLQDYLFDNTNELIYTIDGRLNKDNKPTLQISIKGEVNLYCQRCLDKMAHAIDLKTSLLLVENEAELCQYDEEDSIDTILATPSIDVWVLIEDEIILNLPMTPCHQEDTCKIDHLVKNSTEQLTHPFAALTALKKTH
ncbi:uncharacterized protein SAMN05216419_100716 [Nitrosomonas cryotolerans]|uniref:Large ribosomal RNA subunit accumulation protein YceD n=1 Tax=Nitrosomonas cryotolerans ATCC 49181 TaxID=1131553 RepID=A0A1N6GK12_9PROT|nr:DUF177 domain-containing protein [Nitrosomonas cryotolerans]SFP56131.1 uncharacterized protein SAMN05216419_100716 [Nitrosomonas cryotolerans]SIO07859.1 uncharacterized protein SAMN02743940_0741 [Nitrosomonas cryotolerans ATCC 49181]